jgi:thioredoxin-related protein
MKATTLTDFRLPDLTSVTTCRRTMLVVWVYTLLLLCDVPILLAEDRTQLPLTTNLQRDGRLSAQHTTPILLLVSREHCSYCRLLKREVLEPILLGGHHRDHQ